MLTLSKLQRCLLKQPLKTQIKLNNLEFIIRMQSISVFLDIIKVADFGWKNADTSRTQGVRHVISIFLGCSLSMV